MASRNLVNKLDEFWWSDFGACVDNSEFTAFPETSKKLKQARQVCMSCTVRRACLDYAIKYNLSGVYGGMTEDQRFIASALNLLKPASTSWVTLPQSESSYSLLQNTLNEASHHTYAFPSFP